MCAHGRDGGFAAVSCSMLPKVCATTSSSHALRLVAFLAKAKNYSHKPFQIHPKTACPDRSDTGISMNAPKHFDDEETVRSCDEFPGA